MSAVYLYGFARTPASLPDSLAAVDAPGERVEALPSGDLVAFASPITALRLDPLRRHLVAHTRVLEAALGGGAVLPMRFGAIVETRARLMALMRRHHGAILADLTRLDGCIEVGVKASWSRDALWRRIGAVDPGLAAECARLSKSDPNAAYFARIEAGRKVAGRMAQLRIDEAARLDALAAPFAAATKTLLAADDMMFANRALLVSRARETEFFAALKTYAGDEIDLHYVAPVPAYNFVDLKLDAFGLEAA